MECRFSTVSRIWSKTQRTLESSAKNGCHRRHLATELPDSNRTSRSTSATIRADSDSTGCVAGTAAPENTSIGCTMDGEPSSLAGCERGVTDTAGFRSHDIIGGTRCRRTGSNLVGHPTTARRLTTVDDNAGRREAARQGIAITGTPGILSAAAAMGLVKLRPALDALLVTNFHVSQRILRHLRDVDAP
jgi:Domain of unknown function (DUF3368)